MVQVQSKNAHDAYVHVPVQANLLLTLFYFHSCRLHCRWLKCCQKVAGRRSVVDHRRFVDAKYGNMFFHLTSFAKFLARLQSNTGLSHLWNGYVCPSVRPAIRLRQQFGLATAIRSIVGKLFMIILSNFTFIYTLMSTIHCNPCLWPWPLKFQVSRSNANLCLGPLREKCWW